jgi:ketosteroid isomerase-like protein
VSEDRVEIVRETFEAVADEGTDALLRSVSEDFEMVTPADLAAEPDTYRGHDGVRRWFSSFYEAVDRIWFDLLRVEEHGGRVVMAYRMSTRGRSTGLEVGQDLAAVLDFEGDKINRISFFRDWDEARAAVGD